MKMAKNKEEEKKDFMISVREKIGPSISTAPVWLYQKANERLWNKRQKRHWRDTDLGGLYRKHRKKQKTGEKKKIKSGKHKKKKRGRK